ncbi:MAG: hypothetical protein JWO86_8151 [Myxococcaceae bacterium]|jgi:hypothetical protein|nr:hypothetical protein [Myxococcaceae bacterium]MEA2747868.1 hypothetical protein [Myxococcales bacterium]
MRPATLAPLAALVLGSVASLALGCGGGSAPAMTPDSTKDSGAESFGEVNPADVAELDAGSGTATATSAADAGAAAPSASSAPSAPDAKDECAPVGVDFEKRARPKLKECYAVAKKKDPNLQGTVRISVDIDIYGKIKTTKIVEKTLPDSVAQCMLKVVKATPLPEASKCPGKSLTIPVTFPTPH